MAPGVPSPSPWRAWVQARGPPGPGSAGCGRRRRLDRGDRGPRRPTVAQPRPDQREHRRRCRAQEDGDEDGAQRRRALALRLRSGGRLLAVCLAGIRARARWPLRRPRPPATSRPSRPSSSARLRVDARSRAGGRDGPSRGRARWAPRSGPTLGGPRARGPRLRPPPRPAAGQERAGGAAGTAAATAPALTTITFPQDLQVTRKARPWTRSSGTEYRRPQRSHPKITGGRSDGDRVGRFKARGPDGRGAVPLRRRGRRAEGQELLGEHTSSSSASSHGSAPEVAASARWRSRSRRCDGTTRVSALSRLPFTAGCSAESSAEQGLHPLAPEVGLRAAQVAGDDGEGHGRREGGDVALVRIAERADDDVASVPGAELGRHRLERSGVERVQEEGLDEVVAVVPEGDLGAAQLHGRVVEDAAPEAGAGGAGALPLGDDALHHRVGVAADHPVGHGHRPEVVLHDLGREAGLPLIQVDRDEIEVDGGALAEPHEHVQERVAVLASGHGDQDAVPIADEIEVPHRLGGGADEPALQPALFCLHSGRLGPPPADRG